MATSFFRDMQRIVSNREQELTQRRTVLFQSAMQLASARMAQEEDDRRKAAAEMEFNNSTGRMQAQFDAIGEEEGLGATYPERFKRGLTYIDRIINDPANNDIDPDTKEAWRARKSGHLQAMYEIDKDNADLEASNAAARTEHDRSLNATAEDNRTEWRPAAQAEGVPVLREALAGNVLGMVPEAAGDLHVKKVKGFGRGDIDVDETAYFDLSTPSDDQHAENLLRIAGLAYKIHTSPPDENTLGDLRHLDHLASFGKYKDREDRVAAVLGDISNFIESNDSVRDVFQDHTPAYIDDPDTKTHYNKHDIGNLSEIFRFGKEDGAIHRYNTLAAHYGLGNSRPSASGRGGAGAPVEWDVYNAAASGRDSGEPILGPDGQPLTDEEIRRAHASGG